MTIPTLTGAVTFDGDSLQGANIKIKDFVGALTAPKRDISMFPIADENKSIVVSSSKKSRTVNLTFLVEGDTEAEKYEALETLRSYMTDQYIGKELSIEHPVGTTRVYTATLQDIRIQSNYNMHTEGTLIFVCSNPFALAASQTTVTENTITTSPKSIVTVIAGTAAPLDSVITIDVDTETDLTAIKVENTLNGDAITITRAFTASDQIIISYETKKVLVNGSEFDYTGIIPKFEAGSNTWKITSTSTAHDIDAELIYTPTYV